MSGFLSSGFPDQVRHLSEALTRATIEVYEKIQKEKLPIPSKFHYTFNLRDVSKVFQGILMVKYLKDANQVGRLWAHETSRVFADRLINDEDRDWFQELLL